MRLRPHVTQVAVTTIFGGVFVASDLPIRYPVTFTALLTELPAVLVKMTRRAQQLIIQDSMIHDGDRAAEHMMLLMTNQAILFCLMKTDFLSETAPSCECVASEALLGRYALPRLMACRTVFNILVKNTQGTGLSSCIIKEKPRSEGDHDKHTQHLIPVFHRSHLNP